MPLSADGADDDTWLRELTAAHYTELVCFISNMLYPNFVDLAPLAVNDALHLAVQRRGELDEDPTGWLYAVARNKARTRRRHEKRFSDRQAPLESLTEHPVSAEPDEKILINDAYQDLVRPLKPVDRILLWLTDVDKRPHEQVATIMGRIFRVRYSANLVTKRRERALKKLSSDPHVQEIHRLQRLRLIQPRKGDDA
ncbi:DNA-directed RNA polymerase specialized sigma24 family protein [Hamadaea flava]|uniref:RNA polymerase sigma factor n=1 Tax=Hamadaea flava TaxID=1742688 RepID=A0ABV8LZJ2_9ACTN|nr:sigma-70 family RNA polymerase sigma factor [Hamadaea flava]MCP2327002.1 DNA-directed RNA polymerase specialized sigma24 family protein [Hamadaea flava]